MRNLRRFLAFAVTFAMISCGDNTKKEEEDSFTIGDDNRQEQTESTRAASDAGTQGDTDMEASSGDVVEITITGNDQMQFNKEELRVKAGTTIRLTLEHVGELPEQAMGHNFVLLDQGTDVDDFAQRSNQARENDYIPENADEVIAHTEMIGGGETTTIEFEAPEPGTYTFICSFPGHYIQMQGQFIVE